MKRVEILQGDITMLDVDAIVNAANTSLLGGGGVDGAIHRAGGPKMLEECMIIRARQGGCKTGEAVITSGGNLKARYVIHTVGPVWRGGNIQEDLLLANAYRSSLAFVKDFKIQSIAFPNISTGVYGFPKGRAAEIAIQEVRIFLENHRELKRLVFCCYDDENFKIYTSILKT
jgi:O-acetyl-ADP-ribose deacetylase